MNPNFVLKMDFRGAVIRGEALREKMAVRGALFRGEALIWVGGAYLGKYGMWIESSSTTLSSE